MQEKEPAFTFNHTPAPRVTRRGYARAPMKTSFFGTALVLGLLSAIGIAGMDRLVRRNVLAMSGRAVEAAGDVATLLHAADCMIAPCIGINAVSMYIAGWDDYRLTFKAGDCFSVKQLIFGRDIFTMPPSDSMPGTSSAA